MTESTNSQSTAAWVEKALASLLSAPHITIPPGAGIGPIDLFGTRFLTTFTADATGVFDGQHVDHQGLEDKLLALQTHYNPDTVKFQQEPTSHHHHSGDGSEVHVSFSWTTKDSLKHEVSTTSVVVAGEGGSKIASLAMKGKPELFMKSGSA